MGIHVSLELGRAQVSRDHQSLPCTDVLCRPIQRRIGCVGFRCRGQHHRRIGQRDPCLRQAQFLGALHTGTGDHRRHGIGRADILAGDHHQPTARGNQISALQESCQIEHRRRGIRSADGFLQTGEKIVVHVPVSVEIAGGNGRHKLSGNIPRQDVFALVSRRHVGNGLLQHGHCPAHIAAGHGCDIGKRLLLTPDGMGGLLREHLCRTAKPRHHIRRRHRLEFKDGTAGQKCIVHVVIRILRGGGDQSDPSVLHVFQKGLLLLAVEVLDLIQIEENSARAKKSLRFRRHGTHIGKRGSGGIQMTQGHSRGGGDDGRRRSFARAGRAEKDHTGDTSRGCQAAQNAPLPHQMLLSRHILKGSRAKTVRRRGDPDVIRHNYHSERFVYIHYKGKTAGLQHIFRIPPTYTEIRRGDEYDRKTNHRSLQPRADCLSPI